MKNKLLFLSAILIFFSILGAISANDENNTKIDSIQNVESTSDLDIDHTHQNNNIKSDSKNETDDGETPVKPQDNSSTDKNNSTNENNISTTPENTDESIPETEKTENTNSVSKNSKIGIWIKYKDMKKVNLDKLSKYGIKHIFLNAKALKKYGKSSVEKFIKQAKLRGMKTHLWIQVFYSNGKWTSPVTKKGKFRYKYINSKIKLVKKYASIKGIAGIHFDYLRFPKKAYKHKNGMKAISYFTKKCVKAIKKKNRSCVVSAAVMPESMRSLKLAYGQNIPVLSKYLDMIIPMEYKGNYKQSRTWIKRVTKIFVKNSKHAEIWAGLQTYKSDSKLKKLSVKTLYNDAKAALNSGATGIVLFRLGLTKYFDFSKL